MSRSILAALAGGAALFFWSFLSWVVLPVHTSTIKTMDNESAVLTELKANIPEKGVYYFPNLAAEQRKNPEAVAAWTERYRQGPIGFLVYDPAGNEPMNPGALGISFILEVLAAGLGVWLFQRSTAPLGSYFTRATYFGTIGILISIAVYLQEWIHMKYPISYSLAFCADAVMGWLLAGLVIAAILKPPVKQQG